MWRGRKKISRSPRARSINTKRTAERMGRTEGYGQNNCNETLTGSWKEWKHLHYGIPRRKKQESRTQERNKLTITILNPKT